MKKSLRGAIILFVLLLVYCTLSLLNTFFLKRDTPSYLPIHELKQRDDIDAVVIGSSVIRNGINPKIMTDKTGLTFFNLGIPGMRVPSVETFVRFAEKNSHPKYFLLALERDLVGVESIQDYNLHKRIWPHFDSLWDRFIYYLNISWRNGLWIENALVFKSDPVKTWEDMKKVLTIDQNSTYYAEEVHAKNPQLQYEGDGFLRALVYEDGNKKLAYEYYAWNGASYPGIPDKQVRWLVELRDTCRKLNAELIVIIPPTHSIITFSQLPNMEFTEEAQRICQEYDIPFWDFTRMKRSLWPDLDSYFYDVGHLSGDGADCFSDAFGSFFSDYLNGQDVSDRFYDSWESCLEEVSLVNAYMDFWYDDDGMVHAYADYIGGPSVEPSFCFTLIRDEHEDILQEFTRYKQELILDPTLVQGETICVYVRDDTHPERPPVQFISECP
ncbi:MAG: hypothetical protein IJ719_02335 [Clostridia bacterium]|nr:hypothetical protein [Clostridia bacterium]